MQNKIFLSDIGINKINLDSGENLIISDTNERIKDICTNNNIIYNSDGNDTLEIFSDSEVEFFKNGNDLTIISTKQKDETDYGKARITIANYFDSEEKPVIKNKYSESEYSLKDNFTIIKTNPDSTTEEISVQNLLEGEGSLYGADKIIPIITFPENPHKFDIIPLDHTFIATGKADIYTGSGDDIIYTSFASDTIHITGDGNKTIYINGDSGSDVMDAGLYSGFIILGNKYEYNLNNFGNFINPKSEAIIKLNFDHINGINYLKSDDDLILSYTATRYNAEKYEEVSNTFTIKNYFWNIYKEISYSTNSLSPVYTDMTDALSASEIQINGQYKKINYLFGSKYNDNIIAGIKNDIIYTGNGNDTIIADKGKDTIYINGQGNKNIHINKGDGNDLIEWTTDNRGRANIIFSESDIVTYKQENSDLLLYRNYDEGKKIKTEITRIKNYYSENGEILDDNCLYVNGQNFDNDNFYTKFNALKIRSNKSNKINISGNHAEVNKKGIIVLDIPDYFNNLLIQGGIKKDIITSVTTINKATFLRFFISSVSDSSIFAANICK